MREKPTTVDAPTATPEPNKPSHIAYTVEHGSDGQGHWNKIGAAWPTKDGGLNLRLSATPVDGNVALRSRESLEALREKKAQQQASPDSAPAKRPVQSP